MKINIEDIANSAEGKITIDFQEKINELENNEIVRGIISIEITSYGVKVEGHVETEVTLECDRCLKSYKSLIQADIDEKFVKEKIVSDDVKELEIKKDNFVEELNGRTDVDITDLVYQSIILNLPNKKLCDINCQGSEELKKIQSEKLIDPRLEIFKKIKLDD